MKRSPSMPVSNDGILAMPSPPTRDQNSPIPTTRSFTTFAIKLDRSRTLDDDLYQQAVDRLGEQALTELIAVAGYYVMVAMTLNAFAVRLAPGDPAPFSDRV